MLLRDYEPRAIRLFSRDELKQSDIQDQYRDDRVRFLLGDVRDRERLIRATKGST